MSAAEKEQPGEQIPDEDQVSRAYLQVVDAAPRLPETEFLFVYDKTRDERAESVYWRKYAPSVQDVHDRGCALQQTISSKRQAKGEPPIKYVGCRTANVGSIRAVKSQRGHRLEVVHYEQFGDKAHAHIAISPPPGIKVTNVKENDRIELAKELVKLFIDLQHHSCP